MKRLTCLIALGLPACLDPVDEIPDASIHLGLTIRSARGALRPEDGVVAGGGSPQLDIAVSAPPGRWTLRARVLAPAHIGGGVTEASSAWSVAEYPIVVGLDGGVTQTVPLIAEVPGCSQVTATLGPASASSRFPIRTVYGMDPCVMGVDGGVYQIAMAIQDPQGNHAPVERGVTVGAGVPRLMVDVTSPPGRWELEVRVLRPARIGGGTPDDPTGWSVLRIPIVSDGGVSSQTMPVEALAPGCSEIVATVGPARVNVPFPILTTRGENACRTSIDAGPGVDAAIDGARD
jgi:hypothetical protein